MTGDSLRGKNRSDGSQVSVRVRLPRNKRQLWKKLRRLDRQLNWYDQADIAKYFGDLAKLDEKRKKIRRRLKGYEHRL